MNTDTNPYSTPTATLVDASSSQKPNRYTEVGEVMVMWEKMRLFYNAILIPYSIVVLASSLYTSSPAIASIPEIAIGGGLLANLAFCAGHFVDGYLTWFGIRQRAVTIFLFSTGLLFTMVMVIVVAFPPATF